MDARAATRCGELRPSDSILILCAGGPSNLFTWQAIQAEQWARCAYDHRKSGPQQRYAE